MKFQTLIIENFGSVEHMEVDFADQGLVLILGRTEDAPKADSNGAGKSLILEAFVWALWGKTIRGGDFSGDGVVNRFVGKNCRVTLKFTGDDETRYTIVRTRKHSEGDKPNDLRVFAYGEWERPNDQLHTTDVELRDMTRAGVRDTQELINEIVGTDFNTFCVMMPGAGNNAAEMTDKQVKDLLERLLRTQVLGKAHDVVKTRQKEAKVALDLATQSRESLEKALEECENRMQFIKDKSEGYDAAQQATLADLDKLIGETESRRAEYERTVSLADGIDAKVQAAQSKLDQALSTIKAEQRLFEVTKESIQSMKNDIDRRRAVAQAEYKRINTKIANMPSGGDCPTCQQVVSDAHVASVTSGLREQVDLISSQLLDLTQESDNTQAEFRAQKDRYDKRIDSLKAEVQLHRNDVKRLQNIASNGAAAVKVLTELDGQLKDLQARREAERTKEDPYGSLIEQTARAAFEKAAEASRKWKEIIELEHKLAVLDYWLEGFSPQGVRSFMLEHVTPLLNTAAQKYANLLTDGEMSVTFHTQKRLKSGKTVEKFNIAVEHTHGGANYSSASKGERARANLVIAFALGDLAALRAHRTFSFRFLDEPFESVDESGTDAIVALLNDQKERFETVFVITHQDHFKQLFPTKLTVVKRDGVSSLEG